MECFLNCLFRASGRDLIVAIPQTCTSLGFGMTTWTTQAAIAEIENDGGVEAYIEGAAEYDIRLIDIPWTTKTKNNEHLSPGSPYQTMSVEKATDLYVQVKQEAKLKSDDPIPTLLWDLEKALGRLGFSFQAVQFRSTGKSENHTDCSSTSTPCIWTAARLSRGVRAGLVVLKEFHEACSVICDHPNISGKALKALSAVLQSMKWSDSAQAVIAEDIILWGSADIPSLTNYTRFLQTQQVLWQHSHLRLQELRSYGFSFSPTYFAWDRCICRSCGWEQAFWIDQLAASRLHHALCPYYK